MSTEHPAGSCGTDRVVKLPPLVQENDPHRVGRRVLRRMLQRLDQPIPAVEQDFQQLLAELLVTDRVAELLDRKNQERVPLIERGLERLELGGRGSSC